MSLIIENLTVEISGKKVLENFSLTIGPGEVHALLGPNGVGKSTLAQVLMGHPDYKVLEGSIRFFGQDLLAMPSFERARAGLFLAFQHPVGIPGVKISEFLRSLYAVNHKEEISVKDFRQKVMGLLTEVGLPRTTLTRDLDDGFSGGERKRLELLQMALVGPKLAVLDELDSGLDIDAVRAVVSMTSKLRAAGTMFLIVTHYTALLEQLRPDRVHILSQGKIATTGDLALAKSIQEKGFQSYRVKEEARVH